MEEVAQATLPQGFGYEWTGTAFQEKAASGAQALIFGLALVLVFLCLAAQYESWGIPFGVLLGIPIGVAGAFLAVWLRGLTNDVYVQIGLVMLIGLAAKNAILIVEFAKEKHERDGLPLVEAALQGGPAPLPAHPHDLLGLHPGGGPPRDRPGRGRRLPLVARHGGLRRHARRHRPRRLRHPGPLRDDRAAPRPGAGPGGDTGGRVGRRSPGVAHEKRRALPRSGRAIVPLPLCVVEDLHWHRPGAETPDAYRDCLGQDLSRVEPTMTHAIAKLFQSYPEIAIFLALATGYALGKLKTSGLWAWHNGIGAAGRYGVGADRDCGPGTPAESQLCAFCFLHRETRGRP